MAYAGMPELSVPGPTSRLDARYTQADDPAAPLALVLPPDPRFGGTMNNRVAVAIHEAFQKCGFTVLRIDYSDTGQDMVPPSEDDATEIGDAAAALNHLQGLRPHASACWAAGYSFGAWVALQLLMRRPEMDGFIAVSPAVNLYDFSFFGPCPAAGLVTTGRIDKTVPKKASQEFIRRLKSHENTEIVHRIIPKADHFYTEGIEPLKKAIVNYLTRTRRNS